MDWDYGFFVYSVIFFEIVFEINVIFVIKFDFFRYGEYVVYSVFGFVGLFLDVKLIYFFEVVSFFDWVLIYCLYFEYNCFCFWLNYEFSVCDEVLNICYG